MPSWNESEEEPAPTCEEVVQHTGLHGVRILKRRCITCGQSWGVHLYDSSEPRVGKEVFVCKCGHAQATGWVEWAHLAPQRRREYFMSSAEVGVMVISTFTPTLFGYFVGPHGWKSAWAAANWGFLVGLGLVAIFWTCKMVIVAMSLRRCPHQEHELHGGWPWNW